MIILIIAIVVCNSIVTFILQNQIDKLKARIKDLESKNYYITNYVLLGKIEKVEKC